MVFAETALYCYAQEPNKCINFIKFHTSKGRSMGFGNTASTAPLTTNNPFRTRKHCTALTARAVTFCDVVHCTGSKQVCQLDQDSPLGKQGSIRAFCCERDLAPSPSPLPLPPPPLTQQLEPLTTALSCTVPHYFAQEPNKCINFINFHTSKGRSMGFGDTASTAPLTTPTLHPPPPPEYPQCHRFIL